mmetsp:Transcript_53388/g.147888  ORF Transcript_53388/g.147888 Transcript_53388/m.147888 type:complete len:325 (-) Transcript_53388:95-1069(-)
MLATSIASPGSWSQSSDHSMPQFLVEGLRVSSPCSGEEVPTGSQASPLSSNSVDALGLIGLELGRAVGSRSPSSAGATIGRPAEGRTEAKAGRPARPSARASSGGCQLPVDVNQRAAVRQGRPIVHIGHYHTHHHHHFHLQSDWGGPGSLPPESVRRAREVKAEANAQRAHGAVVGAALPPRSLPGAAAAFQQRAGSGSGTVPKALVAAALASVAAPASAGDPAGGEPPRASFVDTGTGLSASTAPGAVSAARRAAGVGGSMPKKPTVGCSKQKMPMDEYLALIASLPGERRLQFSPYAVPRSLQFSPYAVPRSRGPASARRGR